MDQIFELYDTDNCNNSEHRLPLIGDVAPEFTASTTNGKMAVKNVHSIETVIHMPY